MAALTTRAVAMEDGRGFWCILEESGWGLLTDWMWGVGEGGHPGQLLGVGPPPEIGRAAGGEQAWGHRGCPLTHGLGLPLEHTCSGQSPCPGGHPHALGGVSMQ